MNDKKRIIELQRQLKIARDVLTKMAEGYERYSGVAQTALDEMRPLDPKYPLQGIVGHERNEK